MNFTQLRYFVTLAKVKNFTQAANILYITQPSLSQSISNLEKELNSKLFSRSTTKVELTYSGELFLKAALHMLAINDETVKQIKIIEDIKMGSLSIGLPYAYSNLVFPQVLQAFATRYPKVKTSLIESRSSDLVNMLVQKGADIIMLDSHSIQLLTNPAAYQFDQILKADPMVFVLPPTHPLCLKGIPVPQNKHNLPTLKLSDICDNRFVMLHPHHRIRKTVNQFFDRTGFAPNIFMEVNHTVSALYNAVYGKAVTVVPFSIFSNFMSDTKGYAFLCEGWIDVTDSYCVYLLDSSVFSVARAFCSTAKEFLLTD